MKFARFPYYFAALSGIGAAVVVLGRIGAFEIVDNTNFSDQSTGIVLYAAGDIADCRKVETKNSPAAKTAAFIAAGLQADPSAAVLTLGDNAYRDGLPIEFQRCYQPTWGRFKERTYPSPGNHEYRTAGASGYFDYFGERAGPARRGYYSVNMARWHVISLNSNLKGQDVETQLNWLRDDLARNKTTCTLAFWHHPLYSSGKNGNSEIMRSAWQILQEAGADLVLVGHDHDYERFAPQNAGGELDTRGGLRQFVVGTGGGDMGRPNLWKAANSQFSRGNVFGVLKLTLKDKSYEWQFLPVGASTAGDAGSAACH